MQDASSSVSGAYASGNWVSSRELSNPPSEIKYLKEIKRTLRRVCNFRASDGASRDLPVAILPCTNARTTVLRLFDKVQKKEHLR